MPTQKLPEWECIVKNLCEKLGHKITIESVKGEYTLVSIEFFKNDFYKETLKNK